MGNLHDHINEDGKLYSEVDEHIEELDEIFGSCECDEDLINERFNERVWEQLDDAMHEPAFFKSFQEKLYDKLIADHAEDLSFCSFKPYLLELIQEKL